MPITPTQSGALSALRAFLLAVMPGDGSGNPATFVGTIAGSVLTVTSVPQGSISTNTPLLCPGLPPGTFIVPGGSGSGGAGTYNLSAAPGAVQEPTTMSNGVSVVQGQPNRIPEPENPYFVVMTPLRTPRLGTNVDTAADCKFTGSISGDTLTVAAVALGELVQGATVFGPTVAANTEVLYQTGGTPGGVGAYVVSQAQTVASGTLSAGTTTLLTSAEEVVQLDFHSADAQGGDLANIMMATFRDDYAFQFFAGLDASYGDVSPLYCDDPSQRPFWNDQSQVEYRWGVDCHLQVNLTTSVPQQFADQVAVTPRSVDAAYPP